MSSMKKEIENIIHDAQLNGWEEVPRRKSTHIQLRHPKIPTLVTLASSPSDPRGLKNIRSVIRRLEKQHAV